jgi:DNA-binding response OmpR family regulator
MRMADVKRGKTFLVIEDSADDAVLIRRAFDAMESCHAFVCRNISEGKAYVQGAGMYQNRQQYPFPNAVICDLLLGEESGMQFLAWLRTKSESPKLPVIILSGAASAKEMAAAINLGADDVLRKPARFEDLQAMLMDLAAKLCS